MIEPSVGVRTLRGTDAAVAVLPVKLELRLAGRMDSDAEYYRRRGVVAKERATQTTDPSVRETLKDVARHGLALVERVEWLDRQLKRQQAEKNR
jgi:hypothetical protein